MALATAPASELHAPISAEVSRWYALWHVMKRKPLGLASAGLIAIIVITAIFADVLAPYDPLAAQPEIRLAAPSWAHPFGTDDIGRDVLSRVIWGARLSLYVGLASVLVGVTLGSLWGIFTGYFGGTADTASQRVVDCVMALPPIILALSLMAAVGQSVNNVILALTILLTPTAARTVRSVALGIVASPYIEAARASGSSHLRIVHEWSGPEWPLIGGFAANFVIGPHFVSAIAGRTLAGVASEAERQAREATRAAPRADPAS